MQSTFNRKRAHSCGVRRVLGQLKLKLKRKLKRLRLSMVPLVARRSSVPKADIRE